MEGRSLEGWKRKEREEEEGRYVKGTYGKVTQTKVSTDRVTVWEVKPLLIRHSVDIYSSPPPAFVISLLHYQVNVGFMKLKLCSLNCELSTCTLRACYLPFLTQIFSNVSSPHNPFLPPSDSFCSFFSPPYLRLFPSTYFFLFLLLLPASWAETPRESGWSRKGGEKEREREREE